MFGGLGLEFCARSRRKCITEAGIVQTKTLERALIGLTTMRLTILGSGDAFCSGGRANACVRIDATRSCLVMEFGATSLQAWKKAGFSSNEIDAVVISHLHGDHFGGLPFLLLDCQFSAGRRRALRLYGPRGLRARLEMAMEAFFPGSSAIHWNFPWDVTELYPGKVQSAAGFQISCLEVIHPSGAPALGLRIARGDKLLAFSGDSSWTPALVEIAHQADLFLCECFSGGDIIVNHLNWDTIKDHLPQLRARKIVLTHMNDAAYALVDEMRAYGISRAEDGAVFEI